MSETHHDFKALLDNWGLGTHFSAFLEEGITDDSFHLLDKETINNIFKKSGPRLIFTNKFMNYMKTQNVTPMPLMADEAFDTVSTASTESTSSIVIYEPDTDFSIKLLDASKNDENVSNYFKRPSVDDFIPVKRSKTHSLFKNGLLELLNTNSEGRVVLLQAKLNNDHRQKIAKIVVNELINREENQKAEIKAEILRQAAQEIVELFPGEKVETYYIPYSSPKIGLRKEPARGKLWSRYINVKAALRIANKQVTSNTAIDGDSKVPDDIQERLNFLRHAVEPYAKVLQLWGETYEVRSKLYRDKTLTDIYLNFKPLKLNFGLDLLESDFNQKYPDKIDIVYTEWPKVSQAILAELKERRINLEHNSIDTTTKALLSLPYLFSPVTLKKGSKQGSWRPTRIEIQESFFFHTETFPEAEKIIECRTLKLENYNIPVQPFGIIVGELDAEESCYIFINDVKYTCESSLRCFELLFKAIHALNLEYPIESKHIWLFVQEIVFHINATSKNSSTACVLSDINHHLSKTEF